MTTKHEY